MTRIDHLSAFLQQVGASEGNSGAPLVFWDGYGLGNQHSGVARYARRLADALKGVGINPMLLANAASCRWFDDLTCFVVGEGSHSSKVRELKLVWPQVVGSLLERALTRSGLGGRSTILHGLSNFNVPAWPRRTTFRRLLTVHDIIPLLEPRAVSAAYYWQVRAVLRRVLTLADAVVCVSDWTRKTLLERYPLIEGKVHVVRNGIDGGGDLSIDWEVAARRALRPQFICVSRYETYKNLEILVKVLDALPEPWQGVVVTDKLGERRLRPLALSTRRSSCLKVVTGLSDGELRRLYQASHVYIHPSRFEGFCLPVAEALVAGLPVVFQKGTAIEEIVSAKVGKSLDEQDEPAAWAQAVMSVFAWQDSGAWAEAITAHIATLPTWDVGARNLKTLYNRLS